MAIQAIEMVEMASEKKLTPKKSGQQWTTFKAAISHEKLELSKSKYNQIKAHLILFQMMYGFMAIPVQERVEMTFQR